MKLKKLILVFLVMIIGMGTVSADCNKTEAATAYDYMAKVYKALAGFSYYHTMYNTTDGSNNLADLEKDSGFLSLNLDDIGLNALNLINYYNQYFRQNGIYGNGSLGDFLLNEYVLGGEYTDECEIEKWYNTTVSAAQNINTIDNLWGLVSAKLKSLAQAAEKTEDFKALEKEVAISYEGLCAYLDSHKGIAEFIETALDIVAYAALGLGVLLGILDFIKAIASQDDAALKKAFQSFIKRIAAIILIFLANFIVTMVLNFVAIPGVNRSNIICDQFNLGNLGNLKK